MNRFIFACCLAGVAVAQNGLLPMFELSRAFALPAEWGRELKVEAGRANVRVVTGEPGLLECVFVVADTANPPTISRVEEEDRTFMQISRPFAFAVSSDESWTVRVDPAMHVLTAWTDTGDIDVGLAGRSDVGVFVGTDLGHISVDLSAMRGGEVEAYASTSAGSLLFYVPRDAAVSAVSEEGGGSVSAAGFERDGETWVHDPPGEQPLSISIAGEATGGVMNVVLLDPDE